MTRMASTIGAGALVVAMIACSLMLWIGIPLIWLYIGSQVADPTQPTPGPYLLVGAGIAVSAALDALLISRLNRAYQRLTGTGSTKRVQLAWQRSLRGERNPMQPTGVLDVIMVATLTLAAAAVGVWFFFFAGSPLPGG